MPCEIRGAFVILVEHTCVASAQTTLPLRRRMTGEN